MPKLSKLEPPLVGSFVSNDCGAKRTDQLPTKHYQAGRDAKERGPIDGWKKSAIWARKEDYNTTGEAVGWPRWETVSTQSCEKYSRSGDASEDDSTMACRRGWNESEDGNAKRVTDEGGDAICHDGLDERRQSSPNVHMVGKGGLSKSACWDRPADGNEKRESGGWPTWPGALSKATRQCTNHQNKKGCWNQSKGWTTAEDGSTMACKRGWIEYEDGREKRENGSDTFEHDGRDGWRQSRSNIHIVDKGSFSKSASWDRAKHENVKRENDGGPGAMSKPTRQCTSHQNRKGYWNQSERWTASEDGSAMSCKRGWNESGDGKEKMDNGGVAFDHDGIQTVDRGSLSKPTSWDQEKDENAERVSDGWRRWPGATSKTTRQCTSHESKKGCWTKSEGWTTSEDDTTMACTKVWNDSGDGKEKRVTADVTDAFDHDGHDGWRSSSSNVNMVDKSSLSKSTSWDKAKGDDEKRENDGWCRWPGAASKMIGQSQGWTAPDDGDLQKESAGRNGDPWMQHGSVMSPKCDWNRPVSWNASKGDSLDRDQRKWDPGLKHTGGDPWKQISSTAAPKAGRRKFGSGTVAQVEDSITRKSKWSFVPDSSDPDASKQHRLRWGASLSSTSGYNGNQSRKGGWSQSWGRIESDHGDSLEENNGRITDLDQSDDPWVEHRPMMLPKGDWKKSASWTESGVGDFESDHRRWDPDFDQIGRDRWEQFSPPELPKLGNSFRERIKLGAVSDFGDPNELKQNTHTFLPKIAGKRPFRDRRRPSHHFCEHEHYQSNDSYNKGAGGFSACYGDSPSGRSQRGSQVRHQIGRKHPDRDADERWESKKARYLQQDRRTSFEDPWKQRDHLQDTGSWSHGSCNDGAVKDKLFQNGTSCDRFLRERRSRHDSFEDHRGCLMKDESKEIYHGRRDSDPRLGSCVDSFEGKDDPKQDFREPDVQLSENRHGLLQNKRSDYKWDQKNAGNVSSWNAPKVSKTSLDGSHGHSHLRIDDEGLIDDTIKSMVGTLKQNVDQNVTNSLHALKTQQSAQSSNPNVQSQKSDSNPKDEVRNHEHQAMLNLLNSSTTQASTVCASTSDPVLVQAIEDHSSSNPSYYRFSPAIIGQITSTTPQELKTSSKKPDPLPTTVPPSDKFLHTSTHFAEQKANQTSGVCDSSRNYIETMNCPQHSKGWITGHSEAVDVQVNGESFSSKHGKEEVGANGELKGGMDNKGTRMFKFALAEFVKEIIKPVWKEGRLSKEAHKTVVKKVVDKVVCVLGANIPQTQERIAQYLSYAKDKLHKLVQDYLEMFINT